jgi:hypothetical protein
MTDDGTKHRLWHQRRARIIEMNNILTTWCLAARTREIEAQFCGNHLLSYLSVNFSARPLA